MDIKERLNKHLSYGREDTLNKLSIGLLAISLTIDNADDFNFFIKSLKKLLIL